MQDKIPSHPRTIRFVITTLLIATIVPSPICVADTQQQLSIRGSDTLIFLGQRFAAMYARASPDTRIVVRGGGSQAALNAVLAKQADIAQFEGEPSASNSSEFVSFRAGVQTIVVYVNELNPVRELTIGQLRSIFLGEITNWKSLGGPDTTILLYAGESTTGILAYFQDSVLRGKEPYPFVGKSNTMELLSEIASHPQAIGYGSLASARGTRPVAIKLRPTSLGIMPSEETIRSMRYPIARYVSWAVPRRRDSAVDTLCHWVLSTTGQLVVEAAGFEPLLPAERTRALAKLDQQ
jgi:phosphate transport system substrate-binding protein